MDSLRERGSTQGTAEGNNGKRRKRKTREITIIREGSLPPGLLEKSLAYIYAKKVRNGTLKITDIESETAKPAV